MILTLILTIIYISFISLGLPDSLLGSAWPSMYEGLGVAVSSAGIVSMIITCGTIFSSAFSDRLINKFSTGPTTVVSVLLTAAALLGFSLSQNFISLCICAIPLGLGAGCVDAGLNNYVAMNFKAKHMSWLHCFWGIGATSGPIIMAACMMNLGSWKSGYMIISIIQFCLVAVLLATLPIWKKVKRSDAVQTEEISNKKIKYSELIKLPGAKPALTVFFCYCAIEMTVGLWGSSFLVISKGIAPQVAAQWISLYYLGITIGRFFSGFLTFKMSNFSMVRLGEGILAIGVLIAIVPFSNGTLMLAGFLLIGLGCAPIFPSLLHETPENFGSVYSQSLMGMQMAFAYVGSTFMPPLFGYLAQFFGQEIFGVYLAGLLVLMIFMVEMLFKKAAKRRLA